MHPHNVLITITGYDRPGVTSALFAALAAYDVEVLDVEQVVIRGRLVLGVALALRGDPGPLRRAATLAAEALGTEIEVTITEDTPEPIVPSDARHHVIVLGRPLRAGAVGEIARRIADLGGNVDAISRLGDESFVGLELMVSGADHGALADTLVTVARETGTDIAVERAELRRRSKRLVLLDADRTLIPTDTLGQLAELAGQAAESARLAAAAQDANGVAGRDGSSADTGAGSPAPTGVRTGGRATGGGSAGAPAAGPAAGGAAPAGTSVADRQAKLLRARVALLTGLPVAALEQVRDGLRWAPGADELVATLQRMGYRCGAVSAGAAQVEEPLLDGLGLDFAVANRLEVSGDTLTGRLVDAGLDPSSKARALVRFAAAYGVPLSQTVAVGGPGATDMVAQAGLGVAVGAGAAGGGSGGRVRSTGGRTPARAAARNGGGTYADALLVVLGLSGPDGVGSGPDARSR